MAESHLGRPQGRVWCSLQPFFGGRAFARGLTVVGACFCTRIDGGWSVLLHADRRWLGRAFARGLTVVGACFCMRIDGGWGVHLHADRRWCLGGVEAGWAVEAQSVTNPAMHRLYFVHVFPNTPFPPFLLQRDPLTQPLLWWSPLS